MMDDGLTMIDILKPADVEVKIRGDGKVLWVNLNGICRLRAKTETLDLIDERPEIQNVTR